MAKRKNVRACMDGLSAKGELTWKLDGHRLVIGGNGRMRDFTDAEHAPWVAQAEQVRSIVVEDGVESIGGRAFCGFDRLETVRLGSAVARIGWRAFDGCSRLEQVAACGELRHWRLPEEPGTVRVGHQALRDTRIPQEPLVIHEGVVLEYTGTDPVVMLPKGVREIEPFAFAHIRLESVTFPATLERVGTGAFYATGLKTVILPAKLQQLDAHAFAGNPELERVFLGRASVRQDPTAFAGTPARTGRRFGRWMLSDAALDDTLVPITSGKWSVHELSAVLRSGGVVLMAYRVWDGSTAVRSCCLDRWDDPLTYRLIPCLSENGLCGERVVRCRDLETFRRRYAGKDTWLSIWDDATGHPDRAELTDILRAWKYAARRQGATLYLSWDRGNFQGPLELELCRAWLDAHPDAFVGDLDPDETDS